MWKARMRRIALLVLGVPLGACSLLGGGRSFDPSGIWDFTTVYQGETVSGTITMSRDSGEAAWTSRIITSITEDELAGTAFVEGRTVRMSFDTGEGVITTVLEFPTDDTFTGTWNDGVTSGRLTGTRRN